MTMPQLIIKKSGIKYQILIYIYRILRKLGLQKIPRKVHVNTASLDEKEIFKKRLPKYLWISTSNSNKTDLR